MYLQFKKNENITKRNILYLFLFAISLALRIAKMALDPLLLRDATKYLIIAEVWRDSNDYQTAFKSWNVPPFSIWTIKQMMMIGLSSEIAGRSINIFIGSLIPVAAYILSCKLLNKDMFGFAVGLLLAFNMTLISYSIQPMRENMYLLFGIITLLCLIDYIKKNNNIMSLLGCSFFCILCLFCRYEAIELFLLVFLIILFRYKSHKSFHKLSMDIFSYCLGLIFFLISIFILVGCDTSFLTRIKSFFYNA